MEAEADNKGDYVACHGKQFLKRSFGVPASTRSILTRTPSPGRCITVWTTANYTFQAIDEHFRGQGYNDWLTVGMGPVGDGKRDEDSDWVHTERDSPKQFELVPEKRDGKTLYRIQDPHDRRRLPKFITRYMLTCRSACRILAQPGASQKASLSEAGTWLVMASKGVR